jgi:hypothetical protein
VTELAVRRASKDGRPVAVVRAVEDFGGCRVETEVPDGVAPPPYTCFDPREALAFLAEAADTLTVLGCDVE